MAEVPVARCGSGRFGRLVGRGASALLLAVLSALVFSAGAFADARYSSVVTAVKPVEPGVKLTVLGSDSQMRLANYGSKVVTVLGYKGEAVGRVLPDGTVQVNLASPSYWLNLERSGGSSIPATAYAKAIPVWKEVNRTGVLVWHDHRMHWMGPSPPSAVKDAAKRTRVVDYVIPIRVGASAGTISGTLWWLGDPKGAPLTPFIILAGVALLGAVGVLAIRRRRGKNADSDETRR
ncbi:MAG: hypothetical protein NTY57_04840 [Solirubrobacterales bacterium]|nr:hypothetical protein [Solirubrobacterales bacterium]